MLLPMDTAKEFKENKIFAGNNQGIYVEFNSDGVETGNYTGTFTLKIDGEIRQIPVSVNVWDIEYTGKRSFQSVFVLYQSTLLRSEYDNSAEMVQNYVDFFLDYKVNLLTHNLKRNDFGKYGKEWLEEVVRNKDNLNYNSIYIPYQYPWNFSATSGNEMSEQAKECVKYIIGLAKICTPENCYMDYAYFYPFELDEADEVAGRKTRAESMLSNGGEVDQMLSYAVSTFKKDGYSEIKDKYGEQEDLSPAQWLTLIAEEFGEFAQEINDNNLGNNFIEEGCQVCATTLCAMEQIFNNSTKVMAKKFVIKKNDKKYVVYATDAEAAKQKLEVKINPDRIVEVADANDTINEQELHKLCMYLLKAKDILTDYKRRYNVNGSVDKNMLKQEINHIVDTINGFRNLI